MSDSEGRSILMVISFLALAGVANGMLGLQSHMHWLVDMMESIIDNPLATAGDVDSYVNELRGLADVQIAKHFSATAQRYKRDMDRTSANVTGIKDFAFNMSNPSAFNSSRFEGVTASQIFRTQDKDYWVLGYSGNASQVLLERTRPGNVLSLVAEFTLSVVYAKLDRVSCATTNGTSWIVMSSTRSNLLSIVSVNLTSGAVKEEQVLTCGAVVGALHMFEVRGRVYFVLGADGMVNDLPAESRLYKLVDRHFDRDEHVRFETSMVRDITGFRYRERKYYLVLGSVHSEGTRVYEFDIQSEEVKLVQLLHGSAVYGLLHYEEKQELQHYIVVLSTETSPKIYRWLNNHLLLWQMLPTESTIQEGGSAQAIALSFVESVLILTNGGKITMYRDDRHAQMVPTFDTEVACSAIDDLSVMNVNEEYVMGFICENLLGGTTMMFRSVLVEQIEQEKGTPEFIHDCLQEVKEGLEDRRPIISEFKDILANNRLLTTDTMQTWTGPVTFLGGLTVNGTASILHSVHITKEDAKPNEETFDEFISEALDLKDEVKALQSNMSEILYHTKDQVIKGPVMAHSITAHLFESNASKITQLNGVPLLGIKDIYFIDGQDQNASSTFFHTMKAEDFVTRGASSSSTVNGIFTDQYMRKSLISQVVSGRHTYTDLAAGNICGLSGVGSPLMVNAINTSSIVMGGSNATFVDKKTFQNFTVLQRSTISLINDIDLSSLAERLVYKNLYETHVLDGNYTLDAVRVSGNVDVATINGVDIMELYQSVVKTSGDFALSGDVIYQTDLRVSGSANTPKLNDIDWEDIVCVPSSDVITGHYHFTNTTVRTAIISDDINGIDISEDAVLVDTDQVIHARMTFLDDVPVTSSEGVLMTPAATINSIDPRDLIRDSMDALVIPIPFNFTSPLLVSGDVTVKTINGLLMDGIEDRFWRKRLDQQIPSSPTIDSVVFKGPVTGESINGHQMEDYLNVMDQQMVNGTYVFQGLVIVDGKLGFLEGGTVDGVDVSALRDNVVYLQGDQFIDGPTTFSRLKIDHDLKVGGKLNGWNVTSDLMRLDESFPHTGNLTFMNKTTATSVKMTNADLLVESLNGMVVEDAAADIVLSNEDATINGSLMFKGNVLADHVDVIGTVDGVALEDLARRSLKKVSGKPQLLTASITVDGGVSFSFPSSLKLQVVNNKPWTDHLMKVVQLDYDGVISGMKTFEKNVSILGDFNPAVLNRINMSRLVSRILTTDTEQTVSSQYFFEGDILAKNVHAPKIDGVDVGALALVDEDGDVPLDLLFTEHVAFLDSVTSTSGFLDGCHILELNSSVIHFGPNRTLELNETATLNGLQVMGDVAAKSKVTAGPNALDVFYFLKKLVRNHEEQDISGKISFAMDMWMSNFSGPTLNGVDINQFYATTVLSNQDETINCDIKFSRNLKVNKTVVTSDLSGLDEDGILIDNLNVTEVSEKAVLTHGGPYHISGRKTFSNLTATALSVEDSIGNVPVQNFVVVSRHDRPIRNLDFNAPITVTDLQVDGLIDGVNLENLLASRITISDNETISRSLAFEAVKVEGDLTVNKINDTYLSNIVLKSGREQQDILDRKTLNGGLVVIGSIGGTEVNGIDLNELNRLVVRRDRNATLGHAMTFRKPVEAKVPVAVRGTVNGFKLSGLGYNMTALGQHVGDQSDRLQDLYMQLANTHSDNLQLACGLYQTMAFGEELFNMDVKFAGKMTFGLLGENLPTLALRNCHLQCSCNMETAIYKLGEDGSMQLDIVVRDRAVFLFQTDGYNGTQLVYQCTNQGGTSIFSFLGKETKVLSSPSLGFPSDVKSFTVEQDGINKTYIVTTGTDLTYMSYGIESSVINVLRIDENQLTRVWSNHSRTKISSLDIAKISGVWCLLVASIAQANDKTDPYTAPTRLYKWNKDEFVLVKEYFGEYVTSATFLQPRVPRNVNFFSMAQLKAANTPLGAFNLRYTTELIVYILQDLETGHGFTPYARLKSYGVVAQQQMFVGDDLYLMALSDYSNTLDVYEYVPSEGFRLFQQLRVCEKPLDLKSTKAGDEEMMLVSCREPYKLISFRFNAKGMSYT